MSGLLTPGARVVYGRRTGTVTAVGGCDASCCQWGASCVTVRFDDRPGVTENRHADTLAPAEVAA